VQSTILSTADVARLFNVTETTVKRWADEGTLKCQKTPGGHRKFPMKYIVEFASEHQYEPVGALTLTGGDAMAWTIETAVLRRDYATLQQAFVDKALSPDQTDLYHFFSYLYQHHIQLWEIYDLILGPGMRDIGDRWHRGEITIGHEHRASYEVLDALARLQAQVHVREHSGLAVVCACMDDELHEIGLRAASYLFESEGWRVHYLGARTPVQALIAVARELQPEVVCISMTSRSEGEGGFASVVTLVEAVREAGGRVIIGGPGLADTLLAALPGVVLCRTTRELLAHVQTYQRHTGPAEGATGGA
jgi:MerR family transcriptional regulator, light-induced transcriptional regulator